MWTHGTFKVTFDRGANTLDAIVPILSQKEGARNIPIIGVKGFNFHINSSKIHISLGGSFLADIADAFVWIFKGIIVS